MASLYDEKTLGAKQQLEFARKLRESATQPQGQMVSGWYVAPSWTQHLQGVAQNILGAYQEKDARNELKDIERQKLADTIRGMNDMGIEAPADMAQRAGTPEQEPSLWDKGKAFVTGEDQPQSVPAQPFAQNVAKEPNKNALLSLMLRNPDMASGIIAMQKAQKENNPDPYFQPPVAATVGGKPMFIRQNARNGEVTPVQIGGVDVVPAGVDVGLQTNLAGSKKGAESSNSIVEVPNPNGGDPVKTLGRNAFPELDNQPPTNSKLPTKVLQDGQYHDLADYIGAVKQLVPNVMQVESGGNPNAVSETGARGQMQVIPSTGAKPGYNVIPLQNQSSEENVRFGTDYLAAMLKKNNGDVAAALRDYNGNSDPQYVQKVFGATPSDKVTNVLGTNGTVRAGQDAQQKTENEVEKQRLIEALKPKKEPALTEAQSNAYLYSKRMSIANDTLEQNKDYSSTALNASKALDGIPLVGTIAHSLLGNKEQKVSQAQRDFVNAVLRKESGAAISKSEFENASKQYFPQVGDSPDVVAQKAANRKIAIEGITAGVPQEFLQKQQSAMQMPPMDAIQAEIARRKAARGQ